MKYKLKKDYPAHKLNTLDLKMKKDLMDGKEVDLEKLPRVLFGKVLVVKNEPKPKLKKEND